MSTRTGNPIIPEHHLYSDLLFPVAAAAVRHMIRVAQSGDTDRAGQLFNAFKHNYTLSDDAARRFLTHVATRS